MDNLDRDAMAARKAGLSYGQYMAAKQAGLHPRNARPKENAPAPSVPAVKPGKRRCLICDEIIEARNRRKFCSVECYKESVRRNSKSLRQKMEV